MQQPVFTLDRTPPEALLVRLGGQLVIERRELPRTLRDQALLFGVDATHGAHMAAAERHQAMDQPGRDDEASILRAIDDAIDVLPLAVQDNFPDAMTRLHTPRAQ